MTEFTLKLADIAVKAEVCFETTKDFCADYLCSEPAGFSVSVGPEDIHAERQIAEKADLGAALSDACLERQALYRKIVTILLPERVILFHGSAIEADGGAYVFAAPSGTGKSTHARLWREVYGNRVKMINDDKPLIRFYESGPVAYGTPWSGKHRLERNVGVPVKGICLLAQSKENSIRKISGAAAFPFILRQTHVPSGTAEAEEAVKLAAELADRADCWQLQCNMDRAAAELSFSAMVEGKTGDG